MAQIGFEIIYKPCILYPMCQQLFFKIAKECIMQNIGFLLKLSLIISFTSLAIQSSAADLAIQSSAAEQEIKEESEDFAYDNFFKNFTDKEAARKKILWHEEQLEKISGMLQKEDSTIQSLIFGKPNKEARENMLKIKRNRLLRKTLVAKQSPEFQHMWQQCHFKQWFFFEKPRMYYFLSVLYAFEQDTTGAAKEFTGAENRSLEEHTKVAEWFVSDITNNVNPEVYEGLYENPISNPLTPSVGRFVVRERTREGYNNLFRHAAHKAFRQQEINRVAAQLYYKTKLSWHFPHGTPPLVSKAPKLPKESDDNMNIQQQQDSQSLNME